MYRKNISSKSPYEKTIGFSRAVRIGNRVITAGTAPVAEDGSTASPGDAFAQTVRCLEIIKQAIGEAGASLNDVVRTRIYIVDPAIHEEVGRAHADYFSDIRPAATMVVVKSLVREDWLVEIEAECQIATE